MGKEQPFPTSSTDSPSPDVSPMPKHPLITLMDDPAPTRETVHQFFSPYRRVSPGWTFYERLKTIFTTIFLLPLRLLYLALATLPILLIARLVLIGRPRPNTTTNADADVDADMKPTTPSGTPPTFDENDPLFQPLSTWRRLLLMLAFPLARSILFISFGVVHIRKRKSPYSSKLSSRLPTHETPAPAYVTIANHLGYIDILVLISVYRGSFVAKGDCELVPLIGLCARALQCMFVRRNQSLTAQLVYRVQSTYACHAKRAATLPSGECPGCQTCMTSLILFPEGTTTNGTAMVPFRSGVFNAGLPVRPVCIRFPHRHFNMSWETIRFREHLFRTMTQFVNHVHCTELPVYTPSPEEVADSRLFAANVQAEMAEVLQQDIVPLSRKHKFLYHSYLLGKEKDEASVLQKARQLFEQDEQLKHFVSSSVEDVV